MKRQATLLMAVILLACLTAFGCSNQGQETAPSPALAPTSTPPQEKTDSANVDVDLTALSSTMVYGEVYNMTVSPEEYSGKIVKMEGQFTVYEDETTGNRYFAVIIMDATACCAQGIEFVWAGEHTYPDDYPKADSIVTVIGEFQTYEENGYTYMHLVDADLSF